MKLQRELLWSELSQIYWNTFGRRETLLEFQTKWHEQCGRVEFFRNKPFFYIYLQGDAEDAAKRKTRASIELQSFSNFSVVTEIPKTAEENSWILLVNEGDILNPCALFLFALEIEKNGSLEFIYSNETFSRQAKQVEWSKFPWSRFNLLHANHIGRSWVARVSLLEGSVLASEVDEHRFFLEKIEKAKKKFIPLFLYHRSRTLSFVVESKTAELLKSQEVRAEEYKNHGDFFLKVSPQRSLPAKISAILCFRNKAEWTIEAVRSLVEQTHKTELEIWLVDNGSEPEQKEKVQKALTSQAKIISMPGPFNYAHMHNEVVEKHATGDILLFHNNDVALDKNTDLDRWACWANQEETGTVGIRLTYPDGRIQHAGISADFGASGKLFRLVHPSHADRWAFDCREVYANTFAACMMRKKVFTELRGLDTLIAPNGFGDTLFQLKAREKGYHCYYLGDISAKHMESGSRGVQYEYWEECQLESMYAKQLSQMVRQDTGFDRMTSESSGLVSSFSRSAKVWFRQEAKWLDPLKPFIKKTYHLLKS